MDKDKGNKEAGQLGVTDLQADNPIGFSIPFPAPLFPLQTGQQIFVNRPISSVRLLHRTNRNGITAYATDTKDDTIQYINHLTIYSFFIFSLFPIYVLQETGDILFTKFLLLQQLR